MPTLVASYWDALVSPESLDRNTEVLLFAIYYSTVISMESQQCEEVLSIITGAENYDRIIQPRATTSMKRLPAGVRNKT
ncbi:hypothetical protein DPV78_011083 [Talaromyces pinophilus]|nr:hypothetical protein DPV78_011083 [Talaromyces pinophilus]